MSASGALPSSRDPLNRLHGTVLGLSVLVILVAVDIPLSWVLAGSYTVAPLLTAVLSRPSRTAIVAGATLVATAASTGYDVTMSTTVHSDVIRVVTALVIGVLAIVASGVRERRELALSQMTRIAEVAQQALLPTIPKSVGGLRLASRYVSATSDALIGGDLYDLAVTAHGTRVLIGDARGKGLDAVQRMTTVLGAFRQSVDRYPDLRDVAVQIDAVLSQVSGDEDFVTALMVEFGADECVTVVNCGHHPPLLVTDSEVRYLDDAAPTVPLGFGVDPKPAAYQFTDGRMLLYTDGLIEARAKRGRDFFDLDVAIEALRGDDVDRALEALVQRLLQHTGGRVNDDVALLVIEREPAGD